MIKTVVLIPHYNNLDCLVRTLKSIYHSTGIDVLVVDDGSKESMFPDVKMLQRVVDPNVYIC
jgi:hypothetical protein